MRLKLVGSKLRRVAALATMPMPMVRTIVSASVRVVERTLRILVHSDRMTAPSRYRDVVKQSRERRSVRHVVEVRPDSGPSEISSGADVWEEKHERDQPP